MTAGFVYTEKPIRIDRGEGPYLYADDGTEYLDVGATYACAPVGHCHPDVVEATVEQVKKLFFVQASYPNDARDACYERLVEVAPGDLDQVWLCNSGTEANEAALKFARSATGCSKIVSTMRSFHGRTMGALATTWRREYREPYEPLIGDVEFVPYADEDALAEAVDADTAAVIVEPVQGEGGINPAPEGYLTAVREITEETDTAMIVDEVQTGIGRTGSMWAVDREGVVPDVLTTAKGLGSGLPIGAALCADWIADGCGPHGSTFSGGPVVSAAATATLDVLEGEELPENASDVGTYLHERIEESDLPVRDVRSAGLMMGIEVKRGSNRVVRDLAIEHQILALPAGRSVVRFLPPLVIDRDHADRVFEALSDVLGDG